jgi:hypothetical protein
VAIESRCGLHCKSRKPTTPGSKGDVHAYPMTTVRNVFDIVPEEVRAAFDGNPHLTMPKVAKAMRMDLKTLGRHREMQNLPVHIKGTGLERRHYVCTLNDVAEFIAA